MKNAENECPHCHSTDCIMAYEECAAAVAAHSRAKNAENESGQGAANPRAASEFALRLADKAINVVPPNLLGPEEIDLLWSVAFAIDDALAQRDADWRLFIGGVRYVEEHGFDEGWTDEVDAAHTAVMERLGAACKDL